MRISILDHRLQKRLSCTQSFVPFPIFIFIFTLLRLHVPSFLSFTNTTRITNFSCQIGGVQVVSSTWCGIPIVAWPVAPRGVMPSSSLTLQNSVCPGGDEVGEGLAIATGGTPRLSPRSQKLNGGFFWGQEMTKEHLEPSISWPVPFARRLGGVGFC